jgi:hypothetical protein
MERLHGQRLLSRYEYVMDIVPLGWKLLATFIVSGFLWVLIFWLASIIASATDYATDAAYQPPKCGTTVCEMYGPGGIIGTWRLQVMAANAGHRTIVVPNGKVCASACALAIGFAMHRGYELRIGPTAWFVPHNIGAIRETPMPKDFKAKMLAYKPFNWP